MDLWKKLMIEYKIFEIYCNNLFSPIVYAGTLLSSSVLILGALFSLVRIGEINLRGGVIDFMIITLSCTVASPVAWEHHYGILLVIFAFILPYLFSQSVFGTRTMPLFILSYTLASNFLITTKYLADMPILNTLQSYLFIAALIVLVFLYTIRFKSSHFTQTL